MKDIITGILIGSLAVLVIGLVSERAGVVDCAPATPPVQRSPIPLGEYRVTAYCSCEKCCGKWADGITACGHKIQPGERFCAAPNKIPFGTILDIPGYGKAPVLDRGGAIKGKRLDIYFDTHQEALNWGVKHLEIKQL